MKRINVLILMFLLLGLAGFSEKPKNFTNSIGVEFVYINSGSYMMGSPEDYGDANEHPQKQVVISDGFYLGKYEVTQEQWEKIMGDNPSKFKGKNLPVENVSYNQVMEFVQKLNQKENTAKYYLPTEEEWEYACRAGTSHRYFHGDNASLKMLDKYAWYYMNSSATSHPAGQKSANAFGLFDMHGNVWEWCNSKSVTDNDSRVKKVSRGGSWSVGAYFCRCAVRDFNYVDNKYFDLGFRLAMKAE